MNLTTKGNLKLSINNQVVILLTPIAYNFISFNERLSSPQALKRLMKEICFIGQI